MQYEIADLPPTLDLPLFTRLLTDVDPAALVDVAPGSGLLRMSTVLGTGTLLEVLGLAGIAVGGIAVEALPSQCCGGCGG